MQHLQLFQLFKQLCQEISKFAWSVKFYLLPVILLSEFQKQICFLEELQITMQNSNVLPRKKTTKKFNRLSSWIVTVCAQVTWKLFWLYSPGDLSVLPHREREALKDTQEAFSCDVIPSSPSYSQCSPWPAGGGSWRGRCRTGRCGRCRTGWSGTLLRTRRLLGIVPAAAKHSQGTSRTKETAKRNKKLSDLT